MTRYGTWLVGASCCKLNKWVIVVVESADLGSPTTPGLSLNH